MWNLWSYHPWGLIGWAKYAKNKFRKKGTFSPLELGKLIYTGIKFKILPIETPFLRIDVCKHQIPVIKVGVTVMQRSLGLINVKTQRWSLKCKHVTLWQILLWAVVLGWPSRYGGLLFNFVMVVIASIWHTRTLIMNLMSLRVMVYNN